MKCKHFKVQDKKAKAICRNCIRWIGAPCEGYQAIANNHLELNKFDAYDQMMRTNKGIQGPM